MGAVGVMLFLEVHADSKMKEKKRVRKVKENRTMTNKNNFFARNKYAELQIFVTLF